VTGSMEKDRIRQQMTDAMKAGDKTRVSVLRMFVSAIRYREDELGHELTDEEITEVAAKEVKKRSESIEAFDGAGRTELAAQERAEREIIAVWAPAQLDDAAVDALVNEAIADTGASMMQDLGKVMTFVMGKAQGQVDGKVVQQKVRARLAG
jgi:uncharacterized protein YqeY